jgi:hypothetical protein
MQAMQAYGVVQVQFHSFLISALDGSEWIATSPGRFTFVKIKPVNYLTGR